MKKMKKRSNGFTLTELAIVIAVIAILIAVLVPTFVSLINSVNESSDKQLVKNINTALSVDEAINGEVNTMSDALAVAAENGYNVDKLTPASSGDIVWDQDSNRFLLINEEGEIVYYDSSVTSASITDTKYKLWYIAQSSSDLGGDYSYYLNYAATGTTISASAGIDVGANSDVTINYSSTEKQSVVFYTNGGTLTIDNSKATVLHYGDADVVTVTAVDTSSYHPYGKITSLTIKQGHLYIEASAEVGTLNIEPDATAAANSIIIDADSSAVVENVLLTVTDSTSTVTNIAVQFNSTVLESKAVSNIDDTTKQTLKTIGETYFGGGLGTESSPFLISTYEHLYNMETYTSSQYYYKQTANITISETSLFSKSVKFNGVYDGDGYSISVDKDLYDIDSVSLFKVGRYAIIQNLNVYSAEYCLMSVAVPTYGQSSEKGEATHYLKLYNVTTNAIDDALVHVSSSNVGFFLAGNYYETTAYTGTDKTEIIFEKCTNNASLSNSMDGACTGVFMGGGPYLVWSSLEIYISYIDCTNKGNIYGSNASGLLIGNCSGVNSADVNTCSKYITVQNVKNTGIISAMKNTGGIFAQNTSWNNYYSSLVNTVDEGSYQQNKNMLAGNSYSIYVNNGVFEILGDNLSDDYTYSLMISMPNLRTTESGSLQGRSLSIDLTKIAVTSESDKIFVTNLSHKIYTASEAVENIDGISSVSDLNFTYVFENQYYLAVYVDSDGVMYIIMQDNAEGETYPYFESDAPKGTYYIYAYNANGTIAGYTEYTYKQT